MSFAEVEEIANAVLYEGYMLYPYRASSVKNQQRWNFGVMCPRSYCEVQGGSESPLMQTECLLRADSLTRLAVKVRFLQIVERKIGRCSATASDDSEFVDYLETDGQVHREWQEAEERVVTCEGIYPTSSGVSARRFHFAGGESREELRDKQGKVAGAIVRRWQTLTGSIEIGAEPCGGDVLKVTVRVENASEFDAAAADPRFGRDDALLHSLASAHIILSAEGGEFLSLLDPPAGYEDAAAQCKSVGAWPVLAGNDATTVLASPIILYDYPKIAPESAGNLFDGTEIDEILSLRILTLTDEEKAEIRRTDDRARELLERTEKIPDEQFMKLHGAVRELAVLKEVPK